MRLPDIASYGITAERGFLCAYDAPSVELEGEFAEARDVAIRLPEILPTGKVRDVLDDMRPISADAAADLDDAQVRMAMVHFSFLVQAYVWGSETPASALPESLAVPIVACGSTGAAAAPAV